MLNGRGALPKYAAEAVGTFCLVFAGTGAIALRLSGLEMSLVFGLVVLAMIYTVGHISGAAVGARLYRLIRCDAPAGSAKAGCC